MAETNKKTRVLSGMRPSGKLHLGHLAGALKNWVDLQKEYQCFYFVADWHALTTEYADPANIYNDAREMVVDWLSCGIDPEQSVIFVQSHIREHAELHLLLSMFTPIPWLERCPSYKELQKELDQKDLHTYGFLGYPVLQAADILIYRAHKVPVGEDQLPHLELTRDIARRFNYFYGERLVVPEPMITAYPRVPGIDGRKMSKSYGNSIYLSDPEPVVREKIQRMVTDPARAYRKDPGNPDVCILYNLHKIYTPEEIRNRIQPECRSAAIGCTDCKQELLRFLIPAMEPIWKKREEILKDPDVFLKITRTGDQKALASAEETMKIVRKAMKISY
jgi:tryptophanyl-tRNA synthetase